MATNGGNKMKVMSRGELEEITKPAVSRSRPGSKASNKASSASSMAPRIQSKMDAALELLTPEEVMTRQDYDMHLVEYCTSDSEYTSEESDGMSTNVNTARTAEIFKIAEPKTDRSEKNKHKELDWERSLSEDDDYAVVRQIKLMEDEAEVEVNSDEERDIVAEIRAEITAQVRQEMHGELAVYKAKREQLKSPPQVSDGADDKNDLEDMEPKLREAILKMRKLDKILERKIKREKQVKRDRIMLQKRLWEELENLKPEGREDSREVKTNMSKFLALTLPPSHNTGVELVETNEPSPPTTPVAPVFHTQVPDDSHQNLNNHHETGSNNDSSRQSEAGTSEHSDLSGNTNSTNTTNGQHRKKKKKKKDFIKRNVELATDAANQIAMTDDEKKRIEDLLADLESLPEVPEDIVDDESIANPYQLQIVAGEGFVPEQDELSRLDDIDQRLKQLMPPEDFAEVASVLPKNLPDSKQSLFIRTGILTKVDELGEQVLRDVREDRDIQKRLQEIEQELTHLTSTVELEIESPTLSEEQLNDLLDMCSRTMSRATVETDSLAQSSRSDTSRETLLENAPKLPDDVLQSLLSDARQSVTGSNTERSSHKSLSTLNEEDVVLESVSEDTIKELLRNNRATSRAASQASELSADSQSHIVEESQRPVSRPRPDSRGRLALRSAEHAAKLVNYSYEESDSARSEKKPFLPAIDPRGIMSTQKLNNQRLNNQECVGSRSNMPNRTSAFMVHNSLNSASEPNMSSVHNSESDSDSTPTHTPHPPNSQRPNSGGKQRSMSPFTRNTLD